MSIRYRLKRSSGPVHEPIPAHPDAIYRPQNRPVPKHVSSVDSAAAAPRSLDDTRALAAPLAASGQAFSPWWIIGPLLALIAAMALAALIYAMKKKHDSKKQNEQENQTRKKELSNTNKYQNEQENPESDGDTRQLLAKNIPSSSMKPDATTNEQKSMASMPSTVRDNSASSLNPHLHPSNEVINAPFDKSIFPSTHLTDTFPSSKKAEDKNPLNTVYNNLTSPLRDSSSKNLRSLPTHKTESNYSKTLPEPTTGSSASSTTSATQKSKQPNDGLSLNGDKPKLDVNSNIQPTQSHNKQSFDPNLTNDNRIDNNRPIKTVKDTKDLSLSTARDGTNNTNEDKLKPGVDLDRTKNQSDRTPMQSDHKSFGPNSTNTSGHDRKDLSKGAKDDKDSSASLTSSRMNDLNRDKRKSDANLDKQLHQADNLKKAPDGFDPSLINGNRVDRDEPLKTEKDNKDPILSSARSGINDLNPNKLKSDTSFNKKESPSDNLKKAHDTKSTLDPTFMNFDRINHNNPSKTVNDNNDPTLSASSSGMNELNGDKLKSNMNLSKRPNQLDDLKNARDNRSQFDPNSTNPNGTDRIEPIQGGKDDKEPTVTSLDSGINESNADKSKPYIDLNKEENQPNALKNPHDGKSSFDQSTKNDDRLDHMGLPTESKNNKESPSLSSSLGKHDLNTDKLKSNSDPNNTENTENDKAPFDQSSTNVSDLNYPESFTRDRKNKDPTLSSSPNRTNGESLTRKPDNDYKTPPNSPEQHGVGKSPLISNIPTGAKRAGKENLEPENVQTKEPKVSEKTSPLDSNLKEEDSSKEHLSSPSDLNKDNPSSTSTIPTKADALSKSNGIVPSNSANSLVSTTGQNSRSSKPNEKLLGKDLNPVDQHRMLDRDDASKFGSQHMPNFTKGLDSNPSIEKSSSSVDSNNLKKMTNPNDNKSHESKSSLTQIDSKNIGQSRVFMPNVPQCKTNTSDDDDDYDEIYSIPSSSSPPPPNNTSIQQTKSKGASPSQFNSNSNRNSLTYRKRRRLFSQKSHKKTFPSQR